MTENSGAVSQRDPIGAASVRNAACNVCGDALRFWFSRMNREVCHCPSCGHIQVPAGLVRTSSGSSIYEAEQSVFEADGNEEYYLDEGTEAAARNKMRFVRRYQARPHARLLDVGSGYGHFLAEAAKYYDAYGIELNTRAVAWSINEFQIRNKAGSLFDLPASLPETFEIITAWDVIEHLEDPRRALSQIHHRLNKNGWLFLSTPDAGSLVARFLGKHWYYLDPIQHINLFSFFNLRRILEESGFSLQGKTYFGRQYRISYIMNRLRYLGGDSLVGHLMGTLTRMPQIIARRHLILKLWDVMGLALLRKD